MKLYEKYLKDKQAYESAKSYIALLNARDQAGGMFEYSPCHSKFMVTICGQHRAGDKNYHESNEHLNAAVLKALDIRKTLGAGLEFLRLAMVESLKACQAEIDQVKNELAKADA